MKKKMLALLLALSLFLSGCVIEIQMADGGAESQSSAPVQAQPSAPSDGLTIHFIDVGQADAMLLEAGGQFMLVDGGNRDDGQLVVSYLEQQGVEELAAVVCSHAHEDHVGGLPSVLAVYPTKAVYAPTSTYSSRIFDDFVRYTDQQGLEITIPQPGDTIRFPGTEITVLGPVKSYPDPNDTSIVLRIAYGETAFIFTGDMEKGAESDMLNHWDNDSLFQADVLKVGHHGSDTSTGYRFLNAVNPTYGVIPVGTGNDYGHPHKEPLARLNQAGVVLFRTDLLGHVIARTDGREVSFTWQNQSAQPTQAEPAEGGFVGNKNSKKFHSPLCDSLPSGKNRIEFDSFDSALEAGYSPCSSCLG